MTTTLPAAVTRTVERPGNVDLGMHDGLTREEREELESPDCRECGSVPCSCHLCPHCGEDEVGCECRHCVMCGETSGEESYCSRDCFEADGGEGF